jgi:hypothetical protein
MIAMGVLILLVVMTLLVIWGATWGASALPSIDTWPVVP